MGSIPKAGGVAAPLTVGTLNHPMDVTADATNIYFMSNVGALMSMPKGGGPAVTLASDQQPSGPIVVDDTSVYWANHTPVGQDGGGAIRKVAKAGGAPVTLASGFQIAYGVVEDDTSIYYATGATLMKVAKAGGAPITLVSDKDAVWIAVDDTHVYFTDSTTLSVIPKSGGTPKVLMKLEPGGIQNMMGSIAVDATSIYWMRVKTATSNYESWLMKMPK